MKLKIFLCFVFLLGGGFVFGEEVLLMDRLAKDSGAHVEIIKNLKPQTWLELEKPKADPKWGSARGRAWTPKMTYVEDLDAVLYCATGVHGYVKPDGHYMDDLWAYDIKGNQWICLYPGANTKTLKLKLNEHGFEVNENGENVPVSYLSHGYNNMTFNTDTKQFMIMYTVCPWWRKCLPQRHEWLGIQEGENVGIRKAGNLNLNPKHPLFFNILTGKWDRKFVEGDGPGPHRFEGSLEFIPSLHKALYLHSNGVWYYDYKINAWDKCTSIAPKGLAFDALSCYDQKQEMIYVLKGTKFWKYSILEKQWHEISAKNKPLTVGSDQFGAGNCATMTFDNKNNVIIVCLKSHFRDCPDPSMKKGLYIYDVVKNEWEKDVLPLPIPEEKHEPRYSAFYNKKLNVHTYFLANDSKDNGRMFVIRYK